MTQQGLMLLKAYHTFEARRPDVMGDYGRIPYHTERFGMHPCPSPDILERDIWEYQDAYEKFWHLESVRDAADALPYAPRTEFYQTRQILIDVLNRLADGGRSR